MKWSVDKIENNIVLLENILTGEKKEVDILLLPSSIHEGSIIIYDNNTYFMDLSEEEKRRQEILFRFKSLRSKD